MKPAIFISAVSREFKTARQLAANTLLALGYEPVWQDIFETSGDDLRMMLRKKVQDCSAVVQLVGMAYGAEPPAPDEVLGRVSYTQYEALFARSLGKRVIYLMAQDGHPRDADPATIDVAHSDSVEGRHDAEERRRLQAAYRQQILKGEHVYYPVCTDHETELSIRRLRDDLQHHRRGVRRWMAGLAWGLGVIACGMAALTWILRHQAGTLTQQSRQLAESAATQHDHSDLLRDVKDLLVDPQRIRTQLEQAIDAAYERRIRDAEALPNWRQRDEARQAAAGQREEQLSRIDEFVRAMAGTVGSGDATTEFLELTRILQEPNGVEEALAYITHQQESLLSRGRRLVASKQKELRKTLAPLLEGVRLLRAQGQLMKARAACEELLSLDANWPHALHEQYWILSSLGDEALRYDTLAAATACFTQAQEIALRLSQSSDPHPDARRILSLSYGHLGDLSRHAGDYAVAQEHYQQSLQLAQQLVSENPEDLVLQRDESVCHDQLGELHRQCGRVTQALDQFQRGFQIAKHLAARYPQSRLAQRDLSLSQERLGDIYRQTGQLALALEHYEQGLAIQLQLAEGDQPDRSAERDVAFALERLGDLTLQLGQLSKSVESHRRALDIRQRLASADPHDNRAQREMSISLERLGDVSRQAGQLQPALQFYQQSFQLIQQLAIANPQHAEVQRDLSVLYERLGDTYRQLGQLQEARESLQHALTIRQAISQADARSRRDLAVLHNLLGDVCYQAGELPEAQQRFQQALAILQELATKNQTDTQSQRDLSVCYNRLGDVCRLQNRVAEAKDHFQKGQEIAQKLAAVDGADAQAQRDLAISWNKLGDVSRIEGQWAEADGYHRRALALVQALSKSDPTSVPFQRDVSITHGKLGDVNWLAGNPDAALAHYQDSLDIAKTLAEIDRTEVQSQRDLIVAHWKLGDLQFQRGLIGQAREHYRSGAIVLQQLGDSGIATDAVRKERDLLRDREKLCGQADIATGDWNSLLTAGDDALPELLSLRVTLLASQRRMADLVETGHKLRDGKHLYQAARSFAWADKLYAESRSPPPQPDCRQLALECLRTAVAEGFDDFEALRKSSEFQAFHDAADFEALFPKRQANREASK